MTVSAIKAGATDFLTKPVQDVTLLLAIGQALKRSAELANEMGELDELRSRAMNLTSREREVMDLVVLGRLNKEIAYKLGTGESTVKAHRAKVMRKMGVSSVVDLVRVADKIAASLVRDARGKPLGRR